MPHEEHSVERLPGYRRRIRLEPTEGAVLAMLEDDIHGLAVILRHDGETVLSVEPATHRMPWDTCPGAADTLIETFAGRSLCEVNARRARKQNCTHLHDLAVLAAAHALDSSGFTYDILVSDPVEGERILEIRRDGIPIHRWLEQNGTLIAPVEISGLTLMTLRDWIGSLRGTGQEAARLLQWGALVAHGRTMPFEDQSRAAEMPPNCYTFQPGRAARAQRVGDRFDFSDGSRVPLEEFGGMQIASLKRDRLARSDRS